MSTMIGLLQVLVISSLGLLGQRHANAVPLQRTATPEGWVAIEEVGAGEVVWTYDVSQVQWQPGQVAKVFEHAYEGDMVRLQVANDRVVSTGNHPYWVVDGKSLSERGPPNDVPDDQRVFSDQGRWVEAHDLKAGDLLRTRSGTVQIAKVETFTDTTRVYNLEVATYATYAVSPQTLLVHNKSMRNTSLVDDVAQDGANTLGKSKTPIILGETMATRVSPVAERIGASTFKPRSVNPAKWKTNQARWIREQIRSGRQIFDIGTDRLRPNRSLYYGIERAALERAGYHRVFRKWVTADVQGQVKKFRLYEWVKE